MKKVLVTGIGGLIGGLMHRRLRDAYDVSGLDRIPVPDARSLVANISDIDAIAPAFTGIDTVVHTAAFVKFDAGWDDILANNVAGTYNVFESARRAGVRRVVYVSSGDTISGWSREAPYDAIVAGRYDEVPEQWPRLTHTSPFRPSQLYGCSKAWGELLARHFSDAYGMSFIVVRSGVVNREDRPLQPRHFSVWCSQADIADIIARSVAAPDTIKFDTFFALSNNKWSYRDATHAREVLGFVAQTATESFR